MCGFLKVGDNPWHFCLWILYTLIVNVYIYTPDFFARWNYDLKHVTKFLHECHARMLSTYTQVCWSNQVLNSLCSLYCTCSTNCPHFFHHHCKQTLFSLSLLMSVAENKESGTAISNEFDCMQHLCIKMLGLPPNVELFSSLFVSCCLSTDIAEMHKQWYVNIMVVFTNKD